METKTAVRTYTLDYICDVCGKHPMRPNKRPVQGYPIQHQHACQCGFTKNFPDIYPRQLFEEIPQTVEDPAPKKFEEPSHLFAPNPDTALGLPLKRIPNPDFQVVDEVHREPAPVGKTLVQVFAEEMTPEQQLNAALSTTLAKEPPPKRKINRKK